MEQQEQAEEAKVNSATVLPDTGGIGLLMPVVAVLLVGLGLIVRRLNS